MSIESYRQAIGESKRADILRSALANFLKHGYSGAGMAAIAEEADVSTATLYKNFASKEALFTAVAIQAAASVREDLAELPAGATVHEIFMHLLLGYHASQREYQVNDLLRVVIAEVPSSPDLTRKVFKILVDGRHVNIKAYIDTMVKRGMLKPHDTKLGGHFIAGMIKELAVWPALFQPDYIFPSNILDQAREALEIYLSRYGA